MFISIEQVKISLSDLEDVHPFYGISFLVLKAGRIPVGRTDHFPVNAKETEYLNIYYRPDPGSKWYYRVYRTSDKEKHWLDQKYASSASQSTRTRGAFSNALLHEKNTDLWGWHPDYIAVLRSQLRNRKRVQAFHVAVWLYREREWDSEAKPEDIVTAFLEEFQITEEERRQLFDTSIPTRVEIGSLFQSKKLTWNELKAVIGSPPDASVEEGGTLANLEIRGVGPAKELNFRPADRLNLITGDNGLGKTFLLECSWWALTGQWAELPAYPRQDAKGNEPKISFQIAGESGGNRKPASISYDWNTQSWPFPSGRPTIPGLLIYARVDGSFAVWDPARRPPTPGQNGSTMPQSLVFARDDVWQGVEGKTGSYLINGLIRDWVDWQNKPSSSPFETFKRVLRRLSPPQSLSDLGQLEPGTPIRLPGDTRTIPTLKHPYGEVPIVHAAAGVRRIVTLAYLIVWAWEEHKINSALSRKEPQKRMVVLVDEIEAHLHPQWQRVILPALLTVRDDLSADLQVQLLVATHSPLVMASVEPQFDPEEDKLFHLDLIHHRRDGLVIIDVALDEYPFIRYGPVDYWLTSDIFQLRHARSLEAEGAIEDAKKIQLQDDPNSENIRNVSDRLLKYLAEDDEFWPRWLYFAEQHGVRL